MPLDSILSPDQFAISLAPEERLPDFPRLPDWSPHAPIRIRIECRSDNSVIDQDEPIYRAKSRHREDDASTAEIRSAQLVTSQGEMSVVLKFQRSEAAYNSDSVAVELRFNREQRALRELHKKLSDNARSMIPQTLDSSGHPQNHEEASRLSLPMLFCAAGNCAFALSHDALTSEESLLTYLQTQIGINPNVCSGCKHALNKEKSNEPDKGSDDTFQKCLRWLVVLHDELGPTGLIWNYKRVMILTDLGLSLQADLERISERSSKTQHESMMKRFVPMLKSMCDLAKTILEIHQIGWMHLDLNLDNLCIDENNKIRLIDFGHAEKIDASLDSYKERIPLRRADFAAPEMTLRSYSLRLRYSENSWQGLGLGGWPRGWWPSHDDLIELVDTNSQSIWMKIVKTQPESAVLRIEMVPTGVSTLSSSKERRIYDAKIYRVPQPSADLHSFGLIFLCLLTRSMRPVLHRNELSVFERAIAPASDKNSESPISDSNWLGVYRRVFGRYSVLMDETLDRWKKILESLYRDKTLIRFYEYAFQEAVRIAVKCVVRHPTWGYCGNQEGTRNPFARLERDLNNLLSKLERKEIPNEIPHPRSFDQFYSWLVSETRCFIPKQQQIDLKAQLETIQEAFISQDQLNKSLSELEVRVNTVFILIENTRTRLEKVRNYFDDCKRLSKIQRIWLWVKGFFTPKFKPVEPDASITELQEHSSRMSQILEQNEPILDFSEVEKLALQITEFDKHIARSAFVPFERRRVRSLVESSKLILQSLSDTVGQLDYTESKLHLRRIEGHDLLSRTTQLLIKTLTEIVNEKQKISQQLKEILGQKIAETLSEMQKPARQIAAVLRKDFDQFLDILSECQKSSIKSRDFLAKTKGSFDYSFAKKEFKKLISIFTSIKNMHL